MENELVPVCVIKEMLPLPNMPPPHTQQLSIPNILLFGAITVPRKGTERGKCAEDPITSNSDRTSDQDPNPTSEYLNYSYF